MIIGENLILIDNDTPGNVVDKVKEICDVILCKTIFVSGFSRDDLVSLYLQAKVVLDWCMRGSERMPIEAVLRGVVLVTSDCQSVQDQRDFPIPKRNIVDLNSLQSALQRILSNFISEQNDYHMMRNLYMSLGNNTLIVEAVRFLSTIEEG